MVDPSVREKYSISYLRTYTRPDVNNKPKFNGETIYMIIALLIFFFEPLLVMIDRNLVYPVMGGWGANLLILAIYLHYAGKKDKIEDLLNVSMVQEFVLTEKATGKKHPAYALVQGYNLIIQGTASAANMASFDGSSIWEFFGKEGEAKYYAAVGRKNKNVRQIAALLHNEEFQKHIGELIAEKNYFIRDMGYTFFDTYRPLKKKFKGRYYAVPGYRGMEQKILIPTDCGFEEAIKDDMDFVYYKNA